ncbi:hypothetical protein Golax_020559 [Gossypium laxum]|uniref:RNase H type-1 domain-containing protein n=1 Tax=Gossypium laxum TaxID=34288 RepID=A0A7J9B204_9ROSI|nr:hypothetical protein [Gossypium laxum]
MFGCALWTLWSESNKTVHERKQKSGKDISDTIGWYLRELDDTEKESFRSCSGIVARNAHGEVLVSRAVFHPNVGSPFAAEAIACLWTVKTSTKIGWSKVIIEGNALTIIKKCQSDQIDRSEIGVHIRDIHQISQQFGWIRFKHTNNVANQLAHVVANMSLKREEPTYMYGGVPYFTVRRMEAERQREPD